MWRFTERQTAQMAPGFRSIQMTIRSSLPASSTPTSTRSANRPVFELRRITHEYARHAQAGERVAQSVLVPVRAFLAGGPRSGIRGPRARARALARGHSRRPVRAQSPHPRAAVAIARPGGHHPRSRRRHGRGRARLTSRLLELGADAAFARAWERRAADRNIPGREPVRLEDDHVAIGLAAGD